MGSSKCEGLEGDCPMIPRICGNALRKKLKLEDEDPAVNSCVNHILEHNHLVPAYVELRDKQKALSEVKWKEIPFSCTPKGGYLPDKRVQRKTQQVDSMLVPLLKLIDHVRRIKEKQGGFKKITVVEFCGGSGFVILPLAAQVLNDIDSEELEFIIIDFKPISIELAKQRAADAGLSPIVRCITGRIEDFNDPFDVGIALHACGSASDISLDKCIQANASFVIAPCCVGKVAKAQFAGGKSTSSVKKYDQSCLDNNSLLHTSLQGFTGGNDNICHICPRSEAFTKMFTAEAISKEWGRVIKAADYGGHSTVDSNSIKNEKNDFGIRRMCKAIVEHDRIMHANEHNYQTLLLKMTPTTATPKNDIIIGWPTTITSIDFEMIPVAESLKAYLQK